MVATVYHAELTEAQADPVLAALLGRSHTSAPFDRLDWLMLMAEMGLPGADCLIAVAREGDAVAALPLCRTSEGFAPLGSWYSFFVRLLCNDPTRAPALLAALTRSLAPAGAARLAPLPEADAEALAAAFRASGWIGTIEPRDTNHILELAGRDFDA